MPASEARIRANQQNAQHSTGPKTPEGKEQSRRNGMKHGMAGAGVVVPDDAGEVERRNATLQMEMAPQTAIGEILVRQLAMLSVRMEQGAKQGFASIAERVRHASEDFDNERIVRTEELLATLAGDPRRVLRQLRKSPEGVERLIEEWLELRRGLTGESRPKLLQPGQVLAGNLLGLSSNEVLKSRFSALGRATCHDFGGLAESEYRGLDSEAVKAWARALLIERIDAEIAGLEAHYDTLDQRMIDQDRAEAPDRALFDPSHEATLARRYESEARRGFFKALDQFRKVEAEAAECRDIASTEEPALGSSRESRGVTLREPQPAPPHAARSAQTSEMVITESRNRTEAVAREAVRAG